MRRYLFHWALPLTAVATLLAQNPMTIRDIVVSNTDPNLKQNDAFDDSEPSIAVNPEDPNKIAILAFSGSWVQPNTPAPIWYSKDGGLTWTKYFTIPPPPKIAAANGCPCDQTLDWGRGGRLTATFLTTQGGGTQQEETPGDTYSGTTTDPSDMTKWKWWVDGTGAALRTNLATPGQSDQPWVLVNRDPNGIGDNVYVGYYDTTGNGNARTSKAPGKPAPPYPPIFKTDLINGTLPMFSTINPGQRLAVDRTPRRPVYSLYQKWLGLNDNGSVRFALMLNRSLDGGNNWCLPGKAGCPGGANEGIVVSMFNNFQPTPKFCTINALRGGTGHVAVSPVDPGAGKVADVYVVSAGRSTADGLAGGVFVYKMVDDGVDGLKLDSFSVINVGAEAALPSVAVASDGTVGVLFDICDDNGVAKGAKPLISAHFARSVPNIIMFNDFPLLQFSSPVMGNNDPKQRVLGDYQQLKALGKDFYGVFTANGKGFGRPVDNTDPIFFTTAVPVQ